MHSSCTEPAFDLEVTPLLEVLVGKTLEQAQLEVEQEAELEAIADAHEMLVAAQQAEANRVAGMERAAASQAAITAWISTVLSALTSARPR